MVHGGVELLPVDKAVAVAIEELKEASQEGVARQLGDQLELGR